MKSVVLLIMFFYESLMGGCRDYYRGKTFEHELRDMAQLLVTVLGLMEDGVRTNFSFSTRQKELLANKYFIEFVNKRLNEHNARIFFHIPRWVEYYLSSGEKIDMGVVRDYLNFIDDVF